MSFICSGNISIQAGDILNLVSGRRLEKRLHRSSPKSRSNNFFHPCPQSVLFFGGGWCGVKEVLKEIKREEFRVSLDLIGLR